MKNDTIVGEPVVDMEVDDINSDINDEQFKDSEVLKCEYCDYINVDKSEWFEHKKLFMISQYMN